MKNTSVAPTMLWPTPKSRYAPHRIRNGRLAQRSAIDLSHGGLVLRARTGTRLTARIEPSTVSGVRPTLQSWQVIDLLLSDHPRAGIDSTAPRTSGGWRHHDCHALKGAVLAHGRHDYAIAQCDSTHDQSAQEISFRHFAVMLHA